MRRFLIPIFLLASTTAAFADPTPTAGDLAQQDCSRARKLHKTCVLSFGGETINKGPVTGDGSTVTAAQHDKMPSLIKVRADFRPEIIKAAEDLD
jgi:hypothetical protein